jgi:hypothetical protein
MRAATIMLTVLPIELKISPAVTHIEPRARMAALL